MTSLHEGDPFREEQHYSRLAAAYAIVIVVLFVIGVGVYYFGFRNRPMIDNENTRMRSAVKEMIDEND